MKVTLVMVMSLDGRITKGKSSGTSGWASVEDQAVFRRLIDESDAVVMGSATYEAARPYINPTAAKPRIILTTSTEKFSDDAMTEGLVFTAASPREIVDQLSSQGHKRLLLAGGAETNARFLNDNVVDDIYVTIEPLLFGEGTAFTAPLQTEQHLELLETEKLNARGTLLLHYQIIKS